MGVNKMGVKLSEIEEGTTLKLKIRSQERGFDLDAVLKKVVKDDIIIITIDYDSKKKLVFENE